MASFGLPPVRILRPTLWCAGAVGTIYVGCAAYEAHHDYRMMRKQERVLASRKFDGRPLPKTALTYARLAAMAVPNVNPWTDDNIRKRAASVPSLWRSNMRAAQVAEPFGAGVHVPQPDPASVSSAWSESEKVTHGIVGANLAVFALERLLPATAALFSHVPASGHNFTLLTSAFGHVGVFHLALNMYAAEQFMPTVAYSQTFRGSGSHLAAFFLSSGVLSGLAFHLASVWPRPLDRITPARGASGAIMAVVGAFATSFPEAELGLMFIPGSLPAAQFLGCVVLFETYGLFVGFKRLPLAHAAHLAGLAIGSAYVYFGMRTKVWEPLKRTTIDQMQRAGMLDVV